MLILLAYTSGLRRSELASLKVEDVRVSDKVLIVRRGKGMKDRTVPLPSDTVNKLADYIKEMQPVDRVFPLAPSSISDKIHRIALRDGVNIHAHSLRHGYATRLLEKGANIKAVQELLGHARLASTENYFSLQPRHLREAVDLLDTSRENEYATSTKIPPLPKLLKSKPVDKPEITITDANKPIYIDEEGNVFEVQ